MKFVVPKWLDETAKEYWKKHVPHLQDRLNASNIETFAILCLMYSLVRTTVDPKQQKNFLDAYVRLATQFGLTPRSTKLMPKSEDPPAVFF